MSAQAQSKSSSKLEQHDSNKFNWNQIHQHNNRNDCWIVVKGKVYDVTSWVPRHPGGNQILSGAGREATGMFLSYHPLHVEGMLKKYEIGEVEDYCPYYTWESDFYTTVKQRVEAHFKQRGITGSDSTAMFLKSAFIIFTWFVLYYIAMIKGNVMMAVLLGLETVGFACNLCSVVHSQFGISIAHDGIEYFWINHLSGHHPYANREGGFYNEDYDPDSTSSFPVLRTHPNQAWKPHIQYQHWYMWLLIPFSGAKWAVGDFKWMWKKHYNSIEFYKTTWWVMAEMLVFKAVFLMYSLIIPFSLHPIGKAAFLVGVFVWTNGTLFILNFAVNHLLEENIFPDELTVERDWAKLQVLTSSNYATNSIFWTLFSGGLNHQIEHHLFPAVCHMYLPEIAPIVQQACKDYGVHYTNKDTYWKALISYYDFMKKLSYNPDEKKKKT